MSEKGMAVRRKHFRAWCLAGVAFGSASLAEQASAQAVASVSEDIVVTATKRATDASVQVTPLAVTAFSGKQLEALNYKNISSLAVGIPNVMFDEAASVPGTAVFSIRGLGIASTTPSIDPTVGVFVDGLYMGVNSGIVMDSFDLAGIEVLRGPQGVLFGRNVTGGAIVLRTRLPTDKLEVNAHASLESGLREQVDASISGPIIGDVVTAKLAAMYIHDAGWFKNSYDDTSFGKNREIVVRPVVRIRPTTAIETIVRFEHGQAKGDGPSNQNSNQARSAFYLNIDNPGYSDSSWNQVSDETNVHVPFGNGKITNIFGWRRLRDAVGGDFDGLPISTFNINFYTRQSQFSEELRYAGTFGPFSITTGGYYFRQHLLYLEQRLLSGGLVNRTGGGRGNFSTLAGFGSADYAVTKTFTINLGLRYTFEKKIAEVAPIFTGGSSVQNRTLVPTFFNQKSWDDFTPKAGFQWQPSRNTNLYGFWAKGFRSGGYNFRVTDPGITAGPTNPESMTSFEVGLKQDFGGGIGHINIALFRNTIRNVQRDITSVGLLGPAQQTRNAGDLRIQGAEIEGRFRVTHDFLLTANAGYTNGKYTKLVYDLSGDGVINGADYALRPTRLAPWTYGGSAIYDVRFASGSLLSALVSYNYRSKTYISDNNQVINPQYKDVAANLTFKPAHSALSFSVYGHNLLNRLTYVSAVPFSNTAAFGGGPGLPAPQLDSINRGRVLGGEVRLAF